MHHGGAVLAMPEGGHDREQDADDADHDAYALTECVGTVSLLDMYIDLRHAHSALSVSCDGQTLADPLRQLARSPCCALLHRCALVDALGPLPRPRRARPARGLLQSLCHRLETAQGGLCRR